MGLAHHRRGCHRDRGRRDRGLPGKPAPDGGLRERFGPEYDRAAADESRTETYLQQRGERADEGSILVPVLIGAGFAIGALLGRWWALSVPAVFALWIGFTEEVEVPGWYLGLGYGVISGLGVALGILARRGLARPRS